MHQKPGLGSIEQFVLSAKRSSKHSIDYLIKIVDALVMCCERETWKLWTKAQK